MSDILQRIAADKRGEIEQLKFDFPLETIRDGLPDLPSHRFRDALVSDGEVRVVAELKQASPSRGTLIEQFQPANLSRQYQEGGAAALSVLTESKYFRGRYDYMAAARQASGLPVLCKDFVLEEYQIYHARYFSADAVLLIIALLNAKEIRALLEVARQIGMDCLVEAHDEREVAVAIEAGAEIVGINNRDLRDFSVSLETSERLAEKIPEGVIKVTESGIFARKDIERLQQAGYHCFLVGEALVTADDPVQLIRGLRGE